MAIQFPSSSGSATRTPFPSLSQLQRLQSQLFGQLASGNQLTSAAVNPAALTVAEQLTTQVNGLGQAQNNIGDAVSLLNTAEGGMASQEAVLQQQRTLAVQAGDGALAPSDLQIIQGQIQRLGQGLDQTGQQTQFNGIALLNGANDNRTFQVGPNPSQQAQTNLPNSSSQQLGTAAIDVTTSAGQQGAVSAFDRAINATSTNRANVGATVNGLQAQANDAAASQENQSSARSQLADTNIAQASSDLASSLLQQQFSSFALQQQAGTFALAGALLG